MNKYLFLLTVMLLCPLRGQGYELRTGREAMLLGGGALGAGMGLYLTSHIQELNKQEIDALDREGINGFDRGASYRYFDYFHPASDAALALTMALPALLIFSEKATEAKFTVPVMYLETMSITYAVTEISKGAFRRTRPFVYNPDAPFTEKITKDARESFFSGHTSMSFAAATFFTTVYSRYHPGSEYTWLIGAGSYSLAALTGYLRYEGGKHFPTDIITGAVAGTVIGYLVPKLHERADTGTTTILPGMSYGRPVIRLSFCW